MEVFFNNRKLKKICSQMRKAKKALGKKRAEKLFAALDDMDALGTLEGFRALQHHYCHELTGDRKGELALKLSGNWRLIFKPYAEPPPTKEDGGLDWSGVKAVLVTEIVDYH